MLCQIMDYLVLKKQSVIKLLSFTTTLFRVPGSISWPFLFVFIFATYYISTEKKVMQAIITWWYVLKESITLQKPRRARKILFQWFLTLLAQSFISISLENVRKAKVFWRLQGYSWNGFGDFWKAKSGKQYFLFTFK